MSRDAPQRRTFSGTGHRFGLVAARFNADLVDPMLERAVTVLREEGQVRAEDVEVIRVPGSNELPYAVNLMAETGAFDCILALGVVIAGDTKHHEIIAVSTASALHEVGVETLIPVINGILVAENRAQAEARATGEIDRGGEFARAALEMAALKVRLSERLEEYKSAADAAAYYDEEGDVDPDELYLSDDDDYDEDAGESWKDFPDGPPGDHWKS